MSGVTINLHVYGDSVTSEPVPVTVIPAEPEESAEVVSVLCPEADDPLPADPEPLDLSQFEVAEEITAPVNEAEEQWFKKRAGRITCSRFGDLMSTGRKKDDDFSETGLKYLRLKIAERLGSWQTISGAALTWGTENEAEALALYGVRTGAVLNSEPYQFFEFGDDIGGTPDALADDDGCVEAKCPYNPAVHINTVLTGKIPAEYEWQVAGHCLVTDRKWCDFVSYDPRIIGPHKLKIIRWERNDVMLKKLVEKLNLAVEWIENAMTKL